MSVDRESAGVVARLARQVMGNLEGELAVLLRLFWSVVERGGCSYDVEDVKILVGVLDVEADLATVDVTILTITMAS